MATKTPTGQSAEEKLQSIGASPAPKGDPLAGAKEAFKQALEKTNAQAVAQGDEDGKEEAVIIEEPPKKAPAKKAAQAKPVEPPKTDSELAALKAELAAMRAELKQKPEPKPEPQTTDFDAVKAHLAEQFGEDEGETLANALKALIEPREKRLAQLEQSLQSAFEKSRTYTAKNNRTRLKEIYPQLANDSAWKIVEQSAAAAMQSHDSIDDAFDATVKALYGEPEKEEAGHNEEAEVEASRIAASLPTQPTASTSKERKLSSMDKQRAIFDHLFQNPDDIAGAKRLNLKLNKE